MGRAIKLTLIWWLVHLALAAPLALAFLFWAVGATEFSPATDVLRKGFTVGTLVDILRPDGAAVIGSLRVGALATGLVAGLLSPFLIGGTLRVLRTPGAPVLRSLSGGAVEAPGALLLAWGISRALALGLGMSAGFGIAAGVGKLAGELWEPGPFVAAAAGVAVGVLVWWWLLAAGDVAMILRTSPRPLGIFRGLLAGLRAGVRHPLQLGGVWLLRGLIPVALIEVFYFWFRDPRLATPLAIVAVQQAIMLVRAGARVAVLSGERTVVDRLRPPPPSSLSREENQVRPGDDRARQIDDHQQGERPVQPEQVKHDGAGGGEQFGAGQPRPDAGVPEGVRDERVALGEADGGDPKVGEDPVKGL